MKNAIKYGLSLMFMTLSLTAFAGDKTAGEVIDDSWIHTKVETALIGDEAVNINIEVHKGVILMAGWVSTPEIRENAVATARNTKGVVEVIDHLQVQDKSRMAGQTLDDGVIAARVKAELAEHDSTNAFDINVEVRNGIVLLSGFIDSKTEAEKALMLTKNTEGVTDVINGMEVTLS